MIFLQKWAGQRGCVPGMSKVSENTEAEMLLFPLVVLSTLLVGQTEKEPRAAPLVRWQAHKGPTDGVHISDCAKYIVAESMRNELTVWKKEGRKFILVATLKTEFRIANIRIREKDVLLGYFGDNHRVCFSKIVDGKLIPDKALVHEEGLQGISPRPTTLTFSPDSKLVAYTCVKDTAIEVWDFPLRQQKPIRLLDGEGIAWLMAFFEDNSRLAVVNEDDQLRIWDLKTKALLQKVTLPKEAGPFLQMAFSKDNTRIALAYGMNWGWDLEFAIYDLKSKKLVRTRFELTGKAKAKDAVFSPDLLKAYSCDNEGSVHAYSLPGRKQQLLHKAKDDFRSLALFPAGDCLAVGGWSGTITLVPIPQKVR
jgi:WD40 repeat protein